MGGKRRHLSIIAVIVGPVMGIISGLLVSYTATGEAKPFIETIISTATSRAHLESVARVMGPIVASAVGLSLAYRSGFITIGSEGQVLLGALATLGVVSYTSLGDMGTIVPLTVSLLVALLIGGLWGLIPGILRAYLGVNEILSSLMLNYVSVSIVNYMVSGPWRAGAFTATRSIPDSINVGPLTILLILGVLAGAYEVILRYTRLGISLEARGIAPRAAYTYAISPRKAVLYASILAGITAGLGGWLFMIALQRSFTALSQPPGYGYMGVLVAWLSLRIPLATLAGGALFSLLIIAGFSLQTSGIPFNTVLLIQSLIVLSTLAMIALSRR